MVSRPVSQWVSGAVVVGQSASGTVVSNPSGGERWFLCRVNRPKPALRTWETDGPGTDHRQSCDT